MSKRLEDSVSKMFFFPEKMYDNPRKEGTSIDTKDYLKGQGIAVEKGADNRYGIVLGQNLERESHGAWMFFRRKNDEFLFGVFDPSYIAYDNALEGKEAVDASYAFMIKK